MGKRVRSLETALASTHCRVSVFLPAKFVPRAGHCPLYTSSCSPPLGKVTSDLTLSSPMATFPSFLLLGSWQSDPVEGSNLKSSLILASVTLSSSDFHPTSLATPSQSPSPLCYFLEVEEHQGHGSFLHRQPFPG